MAKLTKRLVDRIAPGTSDIVVWDDTLPGSGLRRSEGERAANSDIQRSVCRPGRETPAWRWRR